MHTHAIAVSVPVFGLLALLVPACAATVGRPELEEEEPTAETHQGANEAPIDITKRFMCTRLDVVDCMIRCAIEGTACTPRHKHPYNPSSGSGDLYACRTDDPRSCDYRYSNGDRCYFYKNPDRILCRHNHG